MKRISTIILLAAFIAAGNGFAQSVEEILKNHAEWAEFLNETPPTTLCVNLNKTTTENVISMLQEENFSVERSVLPTALLTTSVGKYSKVIDQHYAHVQDETSQLVSLLTTTGGESIFDFCAGNGGKSLAISSMTMNKKILHAYEKYEANRAVLKRRCDDYGANVVVEESPSEKVYDVVFVDAPCSGLGAARRNPEAKYIQEAGDLPQTQRSILQQAARNVKEGGMLLYAVCTITPEETTQVIEDFLSEDEFSESWLTQQPYQRFLQRRANGAFTSLPRGDLFFLSILHKQKK